jgi:AraC family transcriptional regulator of adaptative response/methylated-DNA-[protein]-cysteine methyltransferase
LIDAAMILHNSSFSATIADIFSGKGKELSTINCSQTAVSLSSFKACSFPKISTKQSPIADWKILLHHPYKWEQKNRRQEIGGIVFTDRGTMTFMSTMPSTKEMQRAYLRKDVSYDGIFFLGVRTTGIFCRPSCPARKPLPMNVDYFSSAREALFAGYRPCKRCRPLEPTGRPPNWVERALELVTASDAKIKDSELRQSGIDPYRVRRYFQKHYGMTFQAYCRAQRMGEALNQLRQGASLDDIALGNGYESHSGFRDAFTRTFGRPPGTSRDLDRIVVSWLESPLGPIVTAANDQGICLLEFTDRRMLETQFDTLKRLFSCAIVPGENEHLTKLRTELNSYFAGELRQFSIPLVYPGSPFQVRVWNELLRIPYGETCSYEELACRIGSASGQRAVGHANGTNRIAILIPCHRVVNKSGKLGGYGGGLWRKQYLLDLEQGTRRLPEH